MTVTTNSKKMKYKLVENTTDKIDCIQCYFFDGENCNAPHDLYDCLGENCFYMVDDENQIVKEL